MDNYILSTAINLLPQKLRKIVSKYYFLNQIKKNSFKSAEVEWENLNTWVKEGDFVIDIGANIGRYTLKLSNLVGEKGRVLSFEPLKYAFEYLTYFQSKGYFSNNVILLNIAASDKNGLVPFLANPGPGNYLFETFTQSKITDSKIENSSEKILALSIDTLNLTRKVKLVKVDVEGHEFEVLKGMTNLIKEFKPILIIENLNDNSIVADFLYNFNYHSSKISENSRNTVFIPK